MFNLFLYPSEIPISNLDKPIVVVRLHQKSLKQYRSVKFHDYAKNEIFTKIVLDINTIKLENISSKDCYLSLNTNKIAFLAILKSRGIESHLFVDVITAVSTSSFLLT